MIKKKIQKLRELIKFHNLDGYIIPKNDAYFSEFSKPDRLKTISNFTGSAGFAIVLKKENFLFVDGRYTIQAKIQSGKFFKIIEIPKFWPKDVLKKYNKKLILGFDPQLFTSNILKNTPDFDDKVHQKTLFSICFIGISMISDGLRNMIIVIKQMQIIAF